MSWKFQKVFALVAIAAAFVINTLPANSQVDRVAQNTQRAAP